LVFWKTSEKCSGAPAPLLAMTGIVTAAAEGKDSGTRQGQ
jgi:hypothetical protein